MRLFPILVAGAILLGLAAPADAGGATYAYDVLGRLTQVSYDNGTAIVYTYDANGNRTSRVVTCSPSGC